MTDQKLPPTFKDFDSKKLRLSTNKKQEGTIYISFDDGSNAIFYVPKCRLAHGISTFDSKEKKSIPPTSPKDNCSFSIEIDENMDYFPKAWNNIENELKALIAKDSKALLGRTYDMDEINQMWASKVKKGGFKDKEKEDERYNSSFAVKQMFNWDTGVSKTTYLDGQNNNEPLNITYLNASTEIPRGSICMMYLRLYKITFALGKLHVSFYPTQVSVNRPTSKDNFAPLPIASDDAIGRVRDEADEDTSSPSNGNGKAPAFEVNNDEIETADSDDDDIATDSIKQVATPRKATKKTPAPTTKDVKPRGRANQSKRSEN